MIPCQRHLFDIPDDVAYFNCAYMSPLSHAVAEAGMKALQRKVSPWKVKPDDFFTESEQARGLFARLVNAGADDIAIIPAVSYGLAVAAKNLPVRAGDRMLVLAEQFPSNVYTWRELAKSTGAEVITVDRPADGDWTRVILEKLDERVAVTALPIATGSTAASSIWRGSANAAAPSAVLWCSTSPSRSALCLRRRRHSPRLHDRRLLQMDDGPLQPRFPLRSA